MLFASKLLSLLVYPLTLSLFLLALAIVLRLSGSSALSRFLVVVATVWLYWCATEFGSRTLLEPLEAAYPAFGNEELPNAQAIVVLGGGMNGESRFGQGGDFNSAGDRLWRGADLFLAGKAPLILLSGGSMLEGAVPEAQLMAARLTALRVPSSALLLEPQSLTTRENALFSAPLLKERGIRHVLLVTSAAHMRRSVALFTAQGLMVTAVATDHQIPLVVGPLPGWLPTIERLERSTRAIHEWVGYAVYQWLGYFDPVAEPASA